MKKPDPSSSTARGTTDSASSYSADTSHMALPIEFDAQATARVWAEWVEAGRLWMSWWMNSLPVMPWPPAGVVLAPPPAPPLRADNTPAQSAVPSSQPQLHTAALAARHVRGPSARHH
ncbi:MAG: hypothetical protein RLZZ584_1269 [Pseudomonadota bacterium]|jgi:hypothetical protein